MGVIAVPEGLFILVSTLPVFYLVNTRLVEPGLLDANLTSNREKVVDILEKKGQK